MVNNNDTLGRSLFRLGIPKDLENQLFETFRQKLPAEIDDAVIYDIMTTNQEILRNYFISQQS